MWVVIGILGGVVFTDTALLWILLYRLRWAETFLMVISSVILGNAQTEELTQYLRSRFDHPAGKKIQDGI